MENLCEVVGTLCVYTLPHFHLVSVPLTYLTSMLNEVKVDVVWNVQPSLSLSQVEYVMSNDI